MQINLTAVPVVLATTDTVLTALVDDAKTFGLEVKNTGANALDVFEVWGKFSDDGNEVLLLSTGANYTTPNYPCLRASGSPVALAAGATAWFFMDVTGLAQVIVKASSAVGATTLEFHGNAKYVS